MKILMLNTEYPPLGGGQGNANRFIYEALANKTNINIDLVTASINQSKKEQTPIGQIYYLNIGKKNRNIHTQSISNLLQYSWKALFKSLILCRKNKYNLIVAWAGVPSGFLAMIIHFLFGTPYLVLLRGADVPFYEKKWEKLDKYIFSKLSPFIWKKSKAVIANSELLKIRANQTAPKQQIGLISNGVDTNKFYPSKLSQTNAKLILISTGRLTERKGYQYAIPALQNLPNVKLILIGEGELKQELEQLSIDCHVEVSFLGYQDQTQIVKHLQNADIFILPSQNEGMSNSLLEAMACGLPIIVTDVGGTKELIQNNGIIIEKRSESSIHQAVKKYLSNPNLIKMHGHNSRKIAENMSWDITADKFYECFVDNKK